MNSVMERSGRIFSSSKPQQRSGYLFCKRLFDIVCSVGGIIVLSPLFLIISVVIKSESKGPVIFRHKRVGQGGRVLYLYKFRSMYEDAESRIKDFTPEQKKEWELNYKLKNDPRITKAGSFLRKTSLDELPQLFNILQGNLSVVGPRPVTQPELDRYGENKEKFLSVKPGLTGYWQAYARSDVDYLTRMEMELYYAENANFWWDLRIFFATFGAVLCRRGAR